MRWGWPVILNARFRWGLFGCISVGRLLPEHRRRSLGLGLLFGFNLPACAYPLMLALLGPDAVSGALSGFATLFAFGLALSLPLVPLVFSAYVLTAGGFVMGFISITKPLTINVFVGSYGIRLNSSVSRVG